VVHIDGDWIDLKVVQYFKFEGANIKVDFRMLFGIYLLGIT